MRIVKFSHASETRTQQVLKNTPLLQLTRHTSTGRTMSCHHKHIAYEPYDNPIVGGWSATFAGWQRSIGRSHAITATQRVLKKHPLVKTGDVAFDERAAAFRAALACGTSKAYDETPEGFAAIGLYLSLHPGPSNILSVVSGKAHSVSLRLFDCPLISRGSCKNRKV